MMAAAGERSKRRPFGHGRAVVHLVACLTVVLSSVTLARPNGRYALRTGLDGGELQYAKHSRRSYCVNAAGKCFSSGQCCRGLVCAAIDDYFGQKPEVPGYCVKEKDLEVCSVDTECGFGGRCVPLGRTGERYCLPRRMMHDAQDEDEAGIEMQRLQQQQQVKPAATTFLAATGGLGSPCASSSDCRPAMKQGDRLCCQDVRRGRQGVKRICDRVTPISTCIA